MFYVYLDTIYGTELIGKVKTIEKAKKIKEEQDKKWKVGDMWRTHISEKEEKELSFYD